jgi:hypothetical protein
LDSVIGFILRMLGTILIEGLLYFTSRIVLPFLTLGRWRVQPLSDHKNLGWHGLFKQRPDGTILVGELPAILFGLLVWAVIGILVFAALRRGGLL